MSIVPIFSPDMYLDDAAAMATGADAGSPGDFQPSGCATPVTIADMAGVAANPATAWTTGQYMSLDTGTECYWDGTAWIAGRAP